ncbi:MAG TPA: hypothetical protein VFE15_05870 [Marmoricola sp.]|jgi:hypothetical protein|nr:hypothetical protein [Marmoricola sp.]
MNRATAVMKMHLVDRLTLVVLPLGILAASFTVNVLVWLPLAKDGRHTGGALAVPAFVLAAAIFAVVRGLPFALGMGVTRRSFVLGTLMTGAVLAVGFGTLYVLLGGLENLTGGWWLHGTFFDYSFFHRSIWPARWLMLVVGFFASWLLGTAVASLYPRWGMVALVIAGPAVVLAGGGAIALLTWQHWWHSVGSWFSGLTPVTSSGWLVLASAVLAAATWGSLRRVSAS